MSVCEICGKQAEIDPSRVMWGYFARKFYIHNPYACKDCWNILMLKKKREDEIEKQVKMEHL